MQRGAIPYNLWGKRNIEPTLRIAAVESATRITRRRSTQDVPERLPGFGCGEQLRAGSLQRVLTRHELTSISTIPCRPYSSHESKDPTGSHLAFEVERCGHLQEGEKVGKVVRNRVRPDASAARVSGHGPQLEGETATAVTVTSQDGSRTKLYRVVFALPAEQIEFVPTRTTPVGPTAEPGDTVHSRRFQILN